MSALNADTAPVAGPSGAGPRRSATRRRPLRGLHLMLLLPPLALVAVSMIWPLATILIRSLTPDGSLSFGHGLDFTNYASILSDSLLRQIAAQTVFLAAMATAITVVLAFPTAYLMSRMSRRGATFLLILILIPFWVSILIRLFAFTTILGRQGVINSIAADFGLGPYPLLFNSTAVVIGMVAYLLPYLILVLYSSMVGIDPSLMTVARTLGSTPTQAFTQIYFPQIRPALISGTLLVFVLGLGFFLTPAILGGPRDITIPVFIQQQITVFQWGRASAAGVVLLLVSLAGYMLAIRMSGVSILAPGGRPVGRGIVAREPLTFSFGTVLSWIVTAIVLLLLLLPLAVIVPSAFGDTTQIKFPPEGFTTRWFSSVLQDPLWMNSLAKSFRVGVGTAVLSTAVGLSLARVFSNTKSLWARSVIQAMAFAPLIIPVILLAIGNYDVQLRLGLVGTDFGLVLAHSIISVPLAFMIISNALNNVDGSLEEAAWSMGVSRIRAFWTIVTPNLVPAITAATLISFMTSWDEAVLALFQTGLAKTLPVTIFAVLKSGVTPAVAAVAVMLIVPIVLGALVYLIRGLRPRRSAHSK